MRVGIVGYGNLGKAVERSVISEGQELVAIFSRRQVSSSLGTKVVAYDKIKDFADTIDTMYLCVGSYNDIERIAPEVLALFNTVDSFDTHSKLQHYKKELDSIAVSSRKVAIIACGWDPGLMSIIRHIFGSIGEGQPAISFWGKGVSQGHSDAIRRIEGVTNAIQYTLPITSDISKARRGLEVVGPRHTRLCYVSVGEGVDKAIVKQKIISMKDYFADYKTKVVFVDEAAIRQMQSHMYHKGRVYKTSAKQGIRTSLTFELDIESNPDFCSSIMVAYSRVIPKMVKNGKYGAYNVLDIPPKLLARDDKYISVL